MSHYSCSPHVYGAQCSLTLSLCGVDKVAFCRFVVQLAMGEKLKHSSPVTAERTSNSKDF